MLPHIVFVHGAWSPPGDYRELEEELQQHDAAVTFVDLPSIQGATADLDADVAAVAEALDGVPGDKMLVAHSYGGMPATGAAVGRALHRLVYIAAFVPDEGESVYSLAASVPPVRRERVIQVKDDGTSTVEPWPPPDAVARFGASNCAHGVASPTPPGNRGRARNAPVPRLARAPTASDQMTARTQPSGLTR